jgi:hypothetical protein
MALTLRNPTNKKKKKAGFRRVAEETMLDESL